MYRHALPPGFVLKSDKKKQEEAAKKDQISLEQFIEVERHKLKPPLTPVTPETFATWKKNRLEKKAAEQEALEKAKATQRAAGKMTGMTGKDMFEFGGELYEHVDEGEEEDEDWDISRMLARYVSSCLCRMSKRKQLIVLSSATMRPRQLRLTLPRVNSSILGLVKWWTTQRMNQLQKSRRKLRTSRCSHKSFANERVKYSSICMGYQWYIAVFI